jgi:hypothetical protein
MWTALTNHYQLDGLPFNAAHIRPATALSHGFYKLEHDQQGRNGNPFVLDLAWLPNGAIIWRGFIVNSCATLCIQRQRTLALITKPANRVF